MQQIETQSSKTQDHQVVTDEAKTNTVTTTAPGEYRVIRRNGKITGFDASKISVAMTKAFLAVEGGQAAASRRIREKVDKLKQDVVNALFRRLDDGGTIHIEDIQDQVELALMRSGEHKVARDYVLYRAKQAEKRQKAQTKNKAKQAGPKIHVIDKSGERKLLDGQRLDAIISEAAHGLAGVDKELILKQAYRNIFDGIAEKDLSSAIVMCARQYIEKDPNYSKAAARLLLDGLRTEVLSFLFDTETTATQAEMAELYPKSFNKYIHKAVDLELLSPELCNFDLAMLAAAIKPERDQNFTYLGFQTLYDRYFIHCGDSRIELPQNFFMRVSMGLAINEVNREEKAIEFYNLLSSFDFMSSTPTLFNSGTLRPQLSSCYLTTVPDDLEGIFNAIKDDALLSKYAGGLGNDWTRVRGLGARIKGTNGESQGVVPFLKVANDTAVAVNQGGKRKGAMCAYLETWHIDIEEFLDLRKNTGDERRRTHDMNTANWIPDLFMERVAKEEKWMLFSPEETPELHDLYGQEFREKYHYYEQKALNGELANSKQVDANEIWRKMLGMLFETGHPWITFKDPCNIRS
ncbi:MAG TPA: ribonucleoside-diphosphate reductase subunit alpha, partial [Oceanospirillales bacterium]|nr:ribonucleoside-diphosphate reductase subunit alpha [Oceanospirillales bacterium]